MLVRRYLLPAGDSGTCSDNLARCRSRGGSSAGQSRGLIIPRSRVQAPPAPPLKYLVRVLFGSRATWSPSRVVTSYVTRTATVGHGWVDEATAAVAWRHRRIALGCASGPGVRRHGSDLEEAAVPHRDRASRAEGRQEAERVRTRMLSQVDERRSPRTRATLGQLLDKWLEVHRRRSIDQAGLREQHPQAHPAVARVVVPDPAGRRRPWTPSTPSCAAVASTVTGGLDFSTARARSTAATSTTASPVRRPTRPTAKPVAAPASRTSAGDWPTRRSARSTGSSAVPSTAESIWQWIAVNPAAARQQAAAPPPRPNAAHRAGGRTTGRARLVLRPGLGHAGLDPHDHRCSTRRDMWPPLVPRRPRPRPDHHSPDGLPGRRTPHRRRRTPRPTSSGASCSIPKPPKC